jgi:hypothetical protein
MAIFGSCRLTALSQIGLPVARASYLAGSASQVTAQYFDIAGNPLVPAMVKYSVYDDCSGKLLAGPVTIAKPAGQNLIDLNGAANAMVSLSRDFESHSLILMIFMVTPTADATQPTADNSSTTAGEPVFPGPFFARVQFDILKNISIFSVTADSTQVTADSTDVTADNP